MIKRKLALIFIIVVGVLLAFMFIPFSHGSSTVPGQNENGESITGTFENWYSITNLLTATGYGLTIFIVAIVIFAVAIIVFLFSLIKGIVAIIKLGIFLFVLAVLIFIACTILSIANMPAF